MSRERGDNGDAGKIESPYYRTGAYRPVVHPTTVNPFPWCPSLELEGNRVEHIRFHTYKNGLKFGVHFQGHSKLHFVGWSTMITLEPKEKLGGYIRRVVRRHGHTERSLRAAYPEIIDWYYDFMRKYRGRS